MCVADVFVRVSLIVTLFFAWVAAACVSTDLLALRTLNIKYEDSRVTTLFITLSAFFVSIFFLFLIVCNNTVYKLRPLNILVKVDSN
jgi:hypothetical protein